MKGISDMKPSSRAAAVTSCAQAKLSKKEKI